MTRDDEIDDRRTILSEAPDPQSDEPLCVRIARLVGVAADRSPTDLEPLQRSVDVDALERLVGSAGPVSVRFQYEGYFVEIESDRTVRVLADDAGV